MNDSTFYLFGGEQEIADNKSEESTKFIKTNNFYQLKIVQKATSPLKPDIIVKNVYCSTLPNPCSAHKILNLADKYIVLMGGSSNNK